MTFDEAMKLTRTVNCPGVYSDEALEALWRAATECPDYSAIVEIGCEWGRSTSLLAQVAKDRRMYLVLIDPFVKHLDGTPGSLVAQSAVKMLVDLDVSFCLLRGYSHRVPYNFGPISLLHIDGNHSSGFLEADMRRFLPYVVDGGFACFHDYGNPEPYTKEVKDTVDRVIAEEWASAKFEEMGLVDTCKVFRKVGIYADYYEKGRP